MYMCIYYVCDWVLWHNISYRWHIIDHIAHPTYTYIRMCISHERFTKKIATESAGSVQQLTDGAAWMVDELHATSAAQLWGVAGQQQQQLGPNIAYLEDHPS